MTYKNLTPHERYRSEPLVLPYTVELDGVAQDVSGWTSITAHLFLATNTEVWSGSVGSGIAYVTDGTDGEIDVTVPTDFAPGTYEIQVWGVDGSSTPKMLAVERVRIAFNSHDRD